MPCLVVLVLLVLWSPSMALLPDYPLLEESQVEESQSRLASYLGTPSKGL